MLLKVPLSPKYLFLPGLSSMKEHLTSFVETAVCYLTKQAIASNRSVHAEFLLIYLDAENV
jgi:hypothetical protein